MQIKPKPHAMRIALTLPEGLPPDPRKPHAAPEGTPPADRSPPAKPPLLRVSNHHARSRRIEIRGPLSPRRAPGPRPRPHPPATLRPLVASPATANYHGLRLA